MPKIKNFTPEEALAAIRLEFAKNKEMGKQLAWALVLSLKYNEENEPPKPPTVNQVITAAKPAAKGLLGLVGVLGAPGDAFDWIETLPGAPPVTRDTFRQWYRKNGKFKETFRREAYRVNDRSSILTTYAEALHLAGFTAVPQAVENFIVAVKSEFGIDELRIV
jgi:hypothetical protein